MSRGKSYNTLSRERWHLWSHQSASVNALPSLWPGYRCEALWLSSEWGPARAGGKVRVCSLSFHLLLDGITNMEAFTCQHNGHMRGGLRNILRYVRHSLSGVENYWVTHLSTLRHTTVNIAAVLFTTGHWSQPGVILAYFSVDSYAEQDLGCQDSNTRWVLCLMLDESKRWREILFQWYFRLWNNNTVCQTELLTALHYATILP